MNIDGLKKIIKEELQNALGEKFSIVQTENNGMEYVIAYPDPNGIETRDGLEYWEMKDRSNRELYFVKDRKEAEEGIKDFNIHEDFHDFMSARHGIPGQQYRHKEPAYKIKSSNQNLSLEAGIDFIILHQNNNEIMIGIKEFKDVVKEMIKYLKQQGKKL